METSITACFTISWVERMPNLTSLMRLGTLEVTCSLREPRLVGAAWRAIVPVSIVIVDDVV